jgi:processive 1,2-diacylglycerol beta-glucosyltransferase
MLDSTRPAGKRVLVLSGSAGAGHVRAAEALVKDFQDHPAIKNGGEVRHWDVLQYMSGLLRVTYSTGYVELIKRWPNLFGVLYERSDRPWKSNISQLFERLSSGPFIKALREYQPDLVVCTHFTPPNVISWLNTRRDGALGGGRKIYPAIVVTDFDVHAMWLVRSYSRYFVALPETKAYLERMGIPPEQVTVSGVPVDPLFRVPKDKAATRRAIGLDPDVTTLLISAGAFGVGPVDKLLAELLRLQTPVQVVAIAGKSEGLKAKFDKLAGKVPSDSRVKIHPIGFTTRMDEYMAASDLLISKPGGLTTAEAMASGLPMCIVNPIPGQEERNSHLLLEAGAAIRCCNAPTLAWKIDELLQDTARLNSMRDKARTFGKPFAGQTIVQDLLG